MYTRTIFFLLDLKVVFTVCLIDQVSLSPKLFLVLFEADFRQNTFTRVKKIKVLGSQRTIYIQIISTFQATRDYKTAATIEVTKFRGVVFDNNSRPWTTWYRALLFRNTYLVKLVILSLLTNGYSASWITSFLKISLVWLLNAVKKVNTTVLHFGIISYLHVTLRPIQV